MTIRASCGAALLLVAACAAPRLSVESPEPRAAIHLDGVVRGHGRVDVPAPYYGRVEVVVAPPPEAGPEAADVRTLVAVDEPVTPWIFPADLLAELALAALHGPVHARAELAPRSRPAPVEGVIPPEVLGLRRRARRALLER